MEFYDHGGDVYSHDVELDFSSNLNPLGMPKAVRDALVAAVDTFDVYPDTACRALTARLAKTEGVSASHIVCTSGASDLIMRVVEALRPQNALICAPAFSEYEKALEQCAAHIHVHNLQEQDGFELTEKVLDDLTSEIDLAFFCTPNNPTGLTIPSDLLKRILERTKETGTFVLLDECFLCFTDEVSAVQWYTHYPQLVVAKAFTKLYSMAGLRLGYGICSDEAFVRQLCDAGQTWAVSTPAQVAGMAALDVAHWERDTRLYVDGARQRMLKGLRSLGLRVIEGRANYLLFQCRLPLYDELLKRGFLIRSCQNYRGLDETWFRVAVKREEENERLLKAMKEVLS